MSRSTDNQWLHRFCIAIAVATLLLIGVGGLVTSHGAGMAVPDWPNTYGYNMFAFPVSQWIGGIFYEHSHRLVASFVGLLVTILALWLYGRKSRPFLKWGGLLVFGLGIAVYFLAQEKWQDAIMLLVVGAISFGASFVWPKAEPAEKWLRRLGLIAFFAVIFQGVLGGLRVTLFKDELGIFHATLAQVFLVLVGALALFTSRWWRRPAEPDAAVGRLRGAFLAATILILLQLMLGATMRHQHAGLAVPDFPLAYGKIWPDMDPAALERINQTRVDVRDFGAVTAFQIGLHMTHRIGAVIVFAAVAICAWRAGRRGGLKSGFGRLALVWFGLIAAQGVLGAATVWSNKAADMATLHVVGGAVCLVLGALLTITAYRPLTPALSPSDRERGTERRAGGLASPSTSSSAAFAS